MPIGDRRISHESELPQHRTEVGSEAAAQAPALAGPDSRTPNDTAKAAVLPMSKLRNSSEPDAAASITLGAPTSIYDLISNRKRNLILFAAAVASLLVPFCDTIYLPALKAVGEDLNADQGLVAASVAIYMFTVGIGSVVWGPMSDRFGRRITYMIGSVVFLGTSIGCIFAPTIGVLVAFRALQGLGVAAYTTTGQGVIADVFAPEVRGTASGLFMIPLLVGPLLGPLLGGVLSQVYGWRSTFICLTVFCGGIIVPLLLVLIPETQQYIVVNRLSKTDPVAFKAIAEAEHIMSNKPKFVAPWVPLRYLLRPGLFFYALLAICIFGSMFATLTEWPARMASPPYSLSEALIGVSYLAMGVAGLVGSPLGGRSSDYCASRFPSIPDARLIVSTAAACVLMPIGLLVYAWTLANYTHIVGPLVGHFIIGVGSAAYLPGLFGYVTVTMQANAAAASAAVQCAMFVTAGILIYVSVPAVHGMGFGQFFTLLAGLEAGLALLTGFVIYRRYCAWKQVGLSQQQQQQLDQEQQLQHVAHV
eukprot:GHRR01012306.1.p1 GENE.GHRR01012306.1~~GHRR01012306.1.p1  ORF type:complete len:533 (+),score=148.56 GHRR01012306.1:152-1750(+)